MAKIVYSESAPQEDSRFSLANHSFELSPGGSFETNDRALLTDAEAHPFLAVEYDAVEVTVESVEDPHVPRSEDVLAAENSKAFDPEQIEADRSKESEYSRTAIDAGRDQDEAEYEGDVAVTRAADDEAADAADKE